MAETTGKPTLAYRHNVADGRHEVGVKVGKLFVPFSTLSDATFAQLVENAENRAETDDDTGGEE
jgi:hypothetical protein